MSLYILEYPLKAPGAKGYRLHDKTVVTGENLQEGVVTAIYLQVNARVLLQAQSLGEPRGLSEDEIPLSRGAQLSALAMERVWEYLCLRAGVDPV